MSESVAGAVARVQAPANVITGPVLKGPHSLAATLAEVSDIPRSCAGCHWLWLPGLRTWKLTQRSVGCPWHGHGLRKIVPWSPERQW